jgi:hypothetical protein
MPIYMDASRVYLVGLTAATAASTATAFPWWSSNQPAATTAATTVQWATPGTYLTVPTFVYAVYPISHARQALQDSRETQVRRFNALRSQEAAMSRELSDFYRQEERRQRVALIKHNESATKRSRELLLEHLTAAQRETFEKNSWFVIEGGKSRTKYRIRAASHMVANIDVLDVPSGFMLDGNDALRGAKITHRLCAHCRLDEVPLFDQLLAQKLMLEYDEERFLSLANRHRAAA